jgi:hypothetical protein
LVKHEFHFSPLRLDVFAMGTLDAAVRIAANAREAMDPVALLCKDSVVFFPEVLEIGFQINEPLIR